MNKVIYAQAESLYSDLNKASLPCNVWYTKASFDLMLDTLSLAKCTKQQAMLASEDGRQVVAFAVNSVQGYINVTGSRIVCAKTAQSEVVRLQQILEHTQYKHDAKMDTLSRLIQAIEQGHIK